MIITEFSSNSGFAKTLPCAAPCRTDEIGSLKFSKINSFNCGIFSLDGPGKAATKLPQATQAISLTGQDSS